MNQAKTPRQFLIAVRWILDKVGWCQLAMAEDASGKNWHIPDLKEQKVKPEGLRFCSLGAIDMVIASNEVREQSVHLLQDELRHTIHMGSIMSFNDSTDKAGVLRLLDTVIRTLPRK